MYRVAKRKSRWASRNFFETNRDKKKYVKTLNGAKGRNY